MAFAVDLLLAVKKVSIADTKCHIFIQARLAWVSWPTCAWACMQAASLLAVPLMPHVSPLHPALLTTCIHIHTHTHTHTYKPGHTHTHVRTHARMHTRMHTHAHTHALTRACTRACTDTHARACTHTRMHTHTCTWPGDHAWLPRVGQRACGPPHGRRGVGADRLQTAQVQSVWGCDEHGQPHGVHRRVGGWPPCSTYGGCSHPFELTALTHTHTCAYTHMHTQTTHARTQARLAASMCLLLRAHCSMTGTLSPQGVWR